jgi:hypothetical protein
LRWLYLYDNRLSGVSLSAGLANLTGLNLSANRLADLALPDGLANLSYVQLQRNQLTNLSIPAGATSLTELYLGGNQLSRLELPSSLTRLFTLDLNANHFASFTLPELANLACLYLNDNQLTNLTLPAVVTNLAILYVGQNRLTNLTVPAGLTNLGILYVGQNPLSTLVLPAPDAGAVFPSVWELRNDGVAVYLYPLETRLTAGLPLPAGAFKFTLSGPPGSYRVQITSDFSTWTDLDSVTNVVGSGEFTDSSAGQRPRSYYRVKLEPQRRSDTRRPAHSRARSTPELPSGVERRSGAAGRSGARVHWSGAIISNPNPRHHRQVANRVRRVEDHALNLRTPSNHIPRPVALTRPKTLPRTLVKPEHVLVLGMCVEQLGDTSVGNTDRSLSTQVRLPLLVQTPQNLLSVATVPSQVIHENHVVGAAISHAYRDNRHNRSRNRHPTRAAARPCLRSYHRQGRKSRRGRGFEQEQVDADPLVRSRERPGGG